MGFDTGFCEGGRLQSCPLRRVSVRKAFTVAHKYLSKTNRNQVICDVIAGAWGKKF